jgi:hypothetical protein
MDPKVSSRLLARTVTVSATARTRTIEADGAAGELDGAGLLERSWRNDGG